MSMALTNSSGWSYVKQVTVATKTELVQGLIFNEFVYKRDKQLRALRKGLGLLKLLQMNPELKNLLVFKQSHLTGTLFLYPFLNRMKKLRHRLRSPCFKCIWRADPVKVFVVGFSHICYNLTFTVAIHHFECQICLFCA